MLAPISRILLRYGAGALVAVGLIDPDMGGTLAGDEDVLALLQIGIGSVAGAATEIWYWAAQKYGWSK